MKKIAIGIVGALVVLASGCGGSDPISVPDVVGMALPDARAAIDDAGFEIEEVDASGGNRSVWSTGNWSVVGQQPAAGSEAARGDTVTVRIENVRDAAEPEPQETVPETEPTAAPEPEPSPEPETEPEPTPTEEARSTQLHADVAARPSGLSITTEVDVHTCSVNLNGGIIRPGYTASLVMLTAGEPYTIPWGDLTDRDGTRFDYSTTAPQTVTIDCYDEDDNWMVDTWSW